MIIIITMLIGIGFTIAFTIKWTLDWGFGLDVIGIGACGLFYSITASFFAYFIVLMFSLNANTIDVVVHEKPISAIADSTGINGNLFAISSNDNIKVIINDNGYKTIEKYDINKCKIYEDDQTKVVYINEITDSKRVDFWLGSNIELGKKI